MHLETVTRNWNADDPQCCNTSLWIVLHLKHIWLQNSNNRQCAPKRQSSACPIYWNMNHPLGFNLPEARSIRCRYRRRKANIQSCVLKVEAKTPAGVKRGLQHQSRFNVQVERPYKICNSQTVPRLQRLRRSDVININTRYWSTSNPVKPVRDVGGSWSVTGLRTSSRR